MRNITHVRPQSKNWGKKPKSELKEIELSYSHHSICLQKTRMSKLDEKFPSYIHLMFLTKSVIFTTVVMKFLKF